MMFYRFIVIFLFFKDKKLKKLVVALKFLYFLTILSLNSNVKGTNLNPENLGTLSAISIKNA